jgi:hypothetical protein
MQPQGRSTSEAGRLGSASLVPRARREHPHVISGLLSADVGGRREVPSGAREVPPVLPGYRSRLGSWATSRAALWLVRWPMSAASTCLVRCPMFTAPTCIHVAVGPADARRVGVIGVGGVPDQASTFWRRRSGRQDGPLLRTGSRPDLRGD